ncbi:MAG: hypothetical protein ACI3Y0_01545 [Prevotella sp.]
MSRKEDIIERLKKSIELKKRIIEEAERRPVSYYRELYRKNGWEWPENFVVCSELM